MVSYRHLARMVALQAIFSLLMREKGSVLESVQNALLELSETLYSGESFAFRLGSKFDDQKFEIVLQKLSQDSAGEQYIQELIQRALPQKRDIAKRCSAYSKSKNEETFMQFLLGDNWETQKYVYPILEQARSKKYKASVLAGLILLPELKEKSPITLSMIVAYDECKDFALELTEGALVHKEDSTPLILANSTDKDLNKVDPLTLAILLIALFEYSFAKNKQPPVVIINEAIELAKEFGKESAPSFVNAVLSQAMNTKKNV